MSEFGQLKKRFFKMGCCHARDEKTKVALGDGVTSGENAENQNNELD